MQVMMVPGRVAVRLDSFLTHVLDVRGSALRPGKEGIKNFLSRPGIEPAFLIV
jgi:hypothetical protein